LKSIIDKTNENGISQSKSQTKKTYPYKFDILKGIHKDLVRSFGYETDNKLPVTLIDTPGMGDVDGIMKDEEHVNNIINYVANATKLNAVLLILNGSIARISSRTKYILQRLYELCPKRIESILYILFTNTQISANFDLSQISVKIEKSRIFSMNNLLFTADGLNYKNLSSDDQDEIKNNYNNLTSKLFKMFTMIAKNNIGAEEYEQLKKIRERLKYVIQILLKLDGELKVEKRKTRSI